MYSFSRNHTLRKNVCNKTLFVGTKKEFCCILPKKPQDSRRCSTSCIFVTVDLDPSNNLVTFRENEYPPLDH